MCFVLSITLLLVAFTAQAAPTPRRRSLLSRRTQTKDPGYYANFGVRGGAPSEDMGAIGDDGSKHDSTLDQNVWTADSMAYKFPFLDNLEPVAPMDRLKNGDGAYDMDAVYVPKYLNVDGFPTVAGKGCKCQAATAADPRIKCECGNSSDTDHYTWLKDTPVFSVNGSNKYTLEPADITYHQGDYWDPDIKSGGVVSPSDALPRANYPNVAPEDRIFPLPASAEGDRIGIKYARYMDQVRTRVEECDTVSKECTVPCKPGDAVVMGIGNTETNVKVSKTFAGNAAQVTFTPSAANGASATASCPVDASCSIFRYCRAPGKACVNHKDVQSHNWAGTLVTTHVCPAGTQVCGTISQVVMATMLKKDGKACKAVAR